MNEEALEIKKRSWLKWSLIGCGCLFLFLLILILFAFLSVPELEALNKTNPIKTSLMEQRMEEAREAGKKYRIRQEWVNFDEIPDLLKNAVRISEDAGFYGHEGIDLDELKESIKKNWEEGRFVRGGSTITQQLAKNLFLGTEKSIWRKIKEYAIARELENTLSKNRIFHLYLNVIELGPGVFGVEAAAQYYFYKPVTYLSDEEIVLLTALIPKPLSENPHRQSRWLNWRCRWICDKLFRYHYIDQAAYDHLASVFNRTSP
jgi:monofunctional biosynthetic peptidoglycan transglycosylase